MPPAARARPAHAGARDGVLPLRAIKPPDRASTTRRGRRAGSRARELQPALSGLAYIPLSVPLRTIERLSPPNCEGGAQWLTQRRKQLPTPPSTRQRRMICRRLSPPLVTPTC